MTALVRHLLIFLVLFAFQIEVEAKELPKPCFECTDLQKSILEGFESADPLNLELESTVYSGDCVWEGYGHSPKRVHHGVAFLEIKNEIVYYGGRFAFFNSANPYRDWTPELAREELPGLYEERRILTHFDDYSFIDFSGDEADQIVRYWFRQLESDLYILGQWGRGNRVLCELNANQ
ncbi:MAG: hypothetical protein HRT45_16060 [Bdellovibrionales bacterium]|nr:hypothetical protein [Bdellovibrionales bacterium]